MLLAGDALPTLVGERLCLRWPQPSDADDLFAVFGDPEVMAYWSRSPMTERAEAEQLVRSIQELFRKQTLFQWVIEEGDSGRVIGTTTLASVDAANKRAEIGFALARDRWGEGLAGAAVELALQFAFVELGLMRIEADVDPRNGRSLARLEGLGFKREGVLRERWRVGGGAQDSVMLGLLRREWRG